MSKTDQVSLVQLEGDGSSEVPSPVVLHRISDLWTDTGYTSTTTKTLFAFGFHDEVATGTTLNAGATSISVSDVGGHYIWFSPASITIGGDVKIRGRKLNDDGTTEASPTEDTFTIGGGDTGHIYMSTARVADNASINRVSGFSGTLDYGLVSPYNAKGLMNVLEMAEIQFEPSNDSNYRLDWLIRKWTPGASGGLSDVMAQRTFRNSDTVKRAKENRPGHDHYLTIDDAIDLNNSDGEEGYIVTINRKSMHNINLRMRGYRQI